jgi:hypothetical protein
VPRNTTPMTVAITLNVRRALDIVH